MKKMFAAGISLLMMFGVIIAGIVCLAVFAGTNWLYLLFGFEIAAIIIAIVLTFGDRRTDVKIRWFCFLVFVPVIGLFSFIFFGMAYPKSVKAKYGYKDVHLLNKEQREKVISQAKETLTAAPQYERTFMIGVNQENELPYGNSKAKFYDNPAKGFVQIFKDIDQAKNYILINFYIIRESELWSNLQSLLIKKAKEGIKIYLIFDFVGSYGYLSYKDQAILKKVGIQIAPYMKMPIPFLNWKSNYRDHRKDISIDGKIGYFGGANISDEYVNLSPDRGLWNDSMVRIEGDAVLGIEKIFASDWKFATNKDFFKLEPRVLQHYEEQPEADKNELVQICTSGPNHQYPGNLDVLMNAISSAKKRVWLSTPYFIPPDELTNLIASTARSGIDVRLVLPGRTDKPFLLDVSKKHADALYDAGVKIYTVNNVFNHTKAYLIDDDLVFTGSTNLDYRAFFSDQQTMGLVYSKDFNKQVEKQFENDFRLSKLWTTKPSKNKNFFMRMLIGLINWAAPLL